MCDPWLIELLRESHPIVWAGLSKEQKREMLEFVRENGHDRKSVNAAYRKVKEAKNGQVC
jgi:hypothetical protein